MSNKHLFFLLLCLLPVCGLAQRPVLQEYVNLRQYQQVVAYADSLTQADSADYVTMSAIGQAYEGLLQYQNAYRCYEHCFHLDTTNNDALSQLARMAMNVGKAAVAKQCFQKVLQRDSADFFANYQLGRLYAQQGDYEQAMKLQLDVLKYARAENNAGSATGLLYRIGYNLNKMQHPKKESLDFLAMAYILAECTNNQYMMAHIRNYLKSTHREDEWKAFTLCLGDRHSEV